MVYPQLGSVDITSLKVNEDGSLDVNVVGGGGGGGGGDASAANQVIGNALLDSIDSKLQSTQPVSLASQPLPTGASTEATLAAIKAKTDNLDVALSTRTKPADTQPVSAAALPLPSGASTETTLAAVNTKLGSALPLPTGASTEATLALIKAKTDNIDVALSTRTKPADTQAISAASLPLPTGAALDATLTGGTQKTKLVDSGGTNVATISSGGAVKVDGSAATQPVSAASLPLPTGASTEATLALIKAKTDNLDVALSTRTKPADTQPVSAASLPLPTGAATETSLGTDGSAPPSIPGSGIRGWLRSIYDTLVAGLTLGRATPSTAAWTSATALNTALTQDVRGYSTVVLTISSGTISGGNITFEVSDSQGFTNAYQISANAQTNLANSASLTRAITTGANESWIFNVSGYSAFRVRLSTVITGAGTVNVTLSPTSGNPGALNLVGQIGTVGLISLAGVRSVGAAQAAADNYANVNIFASNSSVAAPLLTSQNVYGGAFSGAADAVRSGWSKQRTPTVFKTVQATASGDTAVWTPGTGNKFRILAFRVESTANASQVSGGVITVLFRDNTTAMPLAVDIFVPTAAVTTNQGAYDSGWIQLGSFGILSAAANNALNVNLSAAFATGNVRVMVAGVEE